MRGFYCHHIFFTSYLVLKKVIAFLRGSHVSFAGVAQTGAPWAHSISARHTPPGRCLPLLKVCRPSVCTGRCGGLCPRPATFNRWAKGFLKPAMLAIELGALTLFLLEGQIKT